MRVKPKLVLDAIVKQRVIPVFSNADKAVNLNVLRAAVAGGMKVFEFTARVQGAADRFGELRRLVREEMPEVLLGVGTIRTGGQCEDFLVHEPDFVVGPNYCHDVAELCIKNTLSYSPGCATPTELEFAQANLGEDAILKLFPGNFFDPDYVRTVRATNPSLRIMVTGGVKPTAESLSSWFNAGVVAVGIGSELISKDLIAAEDWTALKDVFARALKVASS